MARKTTHPPAAVLEADCPWLFGDSLPGKKRGAAKHYRCLTVEELEAFELPELADDCVLFFWRVASMQAEAIRVIRAWGFSDPKCEIVWQKLTKNGRPWFGMGRIVRAAHETCLIATRGRPKVLNRSTRSRFSAKVGRHSEKPDRFYEIVEALYDGPRVRLFARSERPGWVSLGDEVPHAV